MLDSSTSKELYIAITNCGTQSFHIACGNVIAQLTFTASVMSQEPISANVDSQEIPQEPISANVVAFPTDSKVREQEARRAAKEAGQEIVVVKRKKFVQDHTDDCGEAICRPLERAES